MKTVRNSTTDKIADSLCVGFSDRLLMLIDAEYSTQKQFSELAEISNSGLSQILLCQNNITLHTIYKIQIANPHVNMDWLIAGNGPMFYAKKAGHKSGPQTANPRPKKPVKSNEKKLQKGS